MGNNASKRRDENNNNNNKNNNNSRNAASAEERQFWERQLEGPSPQEEAEEIKKHILSHDSDAIKMELGWRKLTEVPKKVFKFEHLETLILDFNKLTSIPDAITRLTSLRMISYASNPIGPDFPPAILQMTSLTSLGCGLTGLESLPEELFTNLPKLQELRAEANKLAEISENLSRLTDLKALALGSNQITSLPSNCLPPHLVNLDLNRNMLTEIEIKDEIIDTLASSLAILELRENRLTHLPDNLTRLGSLTRIGLSCNSLTELPVGFAKGWSKLGQLRIDFNDFTTLPEELLEFDDGRNFHIDVRGNLWQISHLEHLEPPKDVLSPRSKKEKKQRKKQQQQEEKEREEAKQKMLSTLPEQHVYTHEVLRNFKSGQVYIQDFSLKSKIALAVPDMILPGLYLGCLADSQNKHVLRTKLGITHILTVAPYQPLYPHIFNYRQYTVDDIESEDLSRYFEECIEFIAEARKSGAVLVHCAAGVSRSATITIAYVMRTQNMSFEEAYQFVKSKRDRVCPNAGFRNQLLTWKPESKAD